jgi:Ca-activated chloride channel family protein
MGLLLADSGLSGLSADAREFLAAARFARPEAVWLLLLLPAVGLLNVWARRRSRLAAGMVGRTATVAGHRTPARVRWRWLGFAYPLAWVLLVLGLAGPRWGRSDESGVAVGRDIVVVIDLSRSMRADDVNAPPGGWTKADPADRYAPKRWLAAREAALDLLAGIAARGGHRVGLVVFAAHPKVVCPLTSDYDHVRTAIEEIDGDHPPIECRPGPAETISGTRIGAALTDAVALQDKRFPGFQDLFLLSDGDDPGEDRDVEWRRGTAKAREAGIPVYTVGIGNPDVGTPLALGEELVSTKLEEDVLTRIANETRGEYIPVRTNTAHLGDFFRARLEPLPSREVSDDSLPLPRERYPWFLAPALGLLLLGWVRGR